MLDFSTNLSPITYKVSQVEDANNKSWNSSDQKALNFIDKGKRSNVLDQFYLSTTDKKIVKSN
jgi:inorganic pyrophosphatase/exopolyphosphatase